MKHFESKYFTSLFKWLPQLLKYMSCRLGPTFQHGEWGFSPGTPIKGDECQCACTLLFHLCKAKCRQTAFSFLHLHKMPCSLFSPGLYGALCCWHYRIILLSEIICIMGPGAITSVIQGVTHCNRSWSRRTGLTQPRGLWLQRSPCTDGRAGNKCCPGQGWDERLSLELWVLF